MSKPALSYDAQAKTYTVRFKCPKCGKPLHFEKKKNRVSPQALRLRVFDNHRKAGECVRPAVTA